MGRATIISGGTDGRYVVEMDYGTAQRDALIAKIDLTLYQLGLRKTWQEEQLEDVELGLVSLQNEQDAFINSYVAASKLVPPNKALTDSIKAQLDAKTVEVNRQQLIVQNARNALHMTTAQIKSAELDKAKLNLAEVTEQRQAWCADLTEDASGAVATLEVPGESALILIKPQAPAPTGTDGVLTAREVQSPAQVFWNAAVLPGWQKFLPTFRWGTITELDTEANLCTVALAAATSSAQQLNVNQATTLTSVPVVYMSCHASVFSVGDNVIVEFTGQDWAQPRVIGFLDHPRACGPDFYGIQASYDYPLGYTRPSTGGPLGVWPNYLTTSPPAVLSSFQSASMARGHITWSNSTIRYRSAPLVISWRGPDSRYADCMDWESRPTSGSNAYSFHPGSLIGSGDAGILYDTSYIWVNGLRIDTPCFKVVAAAIYKPEPVDDPDRILVRICSDAWLHPTRGLIRRTVVYDLERSGSTDAEKRLTVALLVQGPTLAIKTTNAAPDMSATDASTSIGWISEDDITEDRWFLQTRPHFNASATKLGAVIGQTNILTSINYPVPEIQYTVGYKPAVITVADWSRETLADTRYTTTRDITLDETVVFGDGPYVESPSGANYWNWSEFTFLQTQAITETIQRAQAVDFVGDDPVYVVADIVYAYTQTESWTDTGAGAPQVITKVGTASTTVTHSMLGTLYSESAAYPGHGGWPVFSGDLSKGVFAIGNLTSAYPSPTNTSSRFLFRFWSDGVENEGTALGGHVAPLSPDEPAEPPTIYYLGHLGTISYTGDDVTNYETESQSTDQLVIGDSYQPPYYDHSAVSPSGAVAYFGFGSYLYGMERVLKNGSLLSVPAYALGDFPTLTAPFFNGSKTPA